MAGAGGGPLSVWHTFCLKAKENLSAGCECLAAGRANAAASRLYYSVFQASAWALAGQGVSPAALQSGAATWNHTMVSQNLRKLFSHRQDRDHLTSYLLLKSLREKADYAPEDVSPTELVGLDARAGRFHARLGL